MCIKLRHLVHVLKMWHTKCITKRFIGQKLLRHLFKYGLMFLIYYTYVTYALRIINCLVFYSMFCPKKGTFFVQNKCFEMKMEFYKLCKLNNNFLYFILHLNSFCSWSFSYSCVSICSTLKKIIINNTFSITKWR